MRMLSSWRRPIYRSRVAKKKKIMIKNKILAILLCLLLSACGAGPNDFQRDKYAEKRYEIVIPEDDQIIWCEAYTQDNTSLIFANCGWCYHYAKDCQDGITFTVMNSKNITIADRK